MSIQIIKIRLNSIGLFCIIFVLISSIYACKKQANNFAPINLSAGLIGYKWQLISATNYDSAGNIINVYKGTAGDSLFFLIGNLIIILTLLLLMLKHFYTATMLPLVTH